MMPAATFQDHRFLSVSTALGDDVLALKEFSGAEKLSSPFAFSLSLVSEQADIEPEAILGTPVAVRLEMPLPGSGELRTRWFHGYVARFQHNGSDRHGLTAYEAEMVPWLWFLTRKSDCRIFRERSVPEILATLFEEAGFKDSFEPDLKSAYEPRDFCVQYRETDFHFASRLMEDEGLYYFFRHERDKHTLVLTDSMRTHQASPGFEELTYRGSTRGGTQDRHYVSGWQSSRLLKPGIYAHNDFNFLEPKPRPNTKLCASKSSRLAEGQPVFEHYESPGGYLNSSEGERYAQTRLEELRCGHSLVEGDSEARGLAPGNLFTLVEHPREDQNGEYLLRELRYEARSAQWASGGADTRPFFTCRFTAMPASGTFRAPRVTPRPRICGPQTAMVCGPPGQGQEIRADAYGRVKVQFHWDRHGHADDNSSCWIRVSQMWAGKNWGALFLPRIGQEVLVEFLDGDPDRPIITGCAYNGESRTPYTVEDELERAKSTIKSLSTPGGKGFNELRFDDFQGAEQVFLHAQKNLDCRTLGESREWVENDRHLDIEGSQFEQIAKGDKHQKVEQGERNERIGGSRHLRTGQNIGVISGACHGLQAGGQVQLGALQIAMEAASSICIKSGPSHVTITPSGISLSGMPVLINSSGNAMFKQPVVALLPAYAQPAANADRGVKDKIDASPLSPAKVPAAKKVPSKPYVPPPLPLSQREQECKAKQDRLKKRNKLIAKTRGNLNKPVSGLTPEERSRLTNAANRLEQNNQLIENAALAQNAYNRPYLPAEQARDNAALESLNSQEDTLSQDIEDHRLRNVLLPAAYLANVAQLKVVQAMKAYRESQIKAAKKSAAQYASNPAPTCWNRIDPDHLPAEMLKKSPELADPLMWQDSGSGFHAVLYESMASPGQYQLAFEGTEMTSLADWQTNLAQGLGYETEQYDQAVRLARSITRAAPGVTMTGHSLGGGLAAAAGTITGRPTTTFNAAGVNDSTLERFGMDGSDAEGTVNNYSIKGEILTSAQTSWLASGLRELGAMPAAAGTTHTMDPASQNTDGSYGPFTPTNSWNPVDHVSESVRLHFMDQVINAIEYEKQQDIATLSSASGAT